MRALAILTILPLVLTTPAWRKMRNRSNRPVQTRGPGFLDSQVAKADPP